MNCEHHIPNPQTNNELICTPCSPKTPREQPANNSNQPIPSTCSHSLSEELFTAFLSNIPAGEEVYVFRNQKICPKIKNRPNRRPLPLRKNLPSRLLWGSGLFRPGRFFLALEIAFPAFSIFNFVGLFAHKCLYIGSVFRFCGVYYESLDEAIQHLFDVDGGAGAALRLSN